MINSTSIKEYINFIHLKKYNSPAPAALKNSWGALSDEELPTQLKGLYHHWDIDDLLAASYERDFYSFQNKAASYNSNGNYSNSQNGKNGALYGANKVSHKKNYLPLILCILIPIIGIGGYVTYSMVYRTSKPDNIATASGGPDTPAAIAAPLKNNRQVKVSDRGIAKASILPEIKASEEVTSGSDDHLYEERVEVLKNLLTAEVDQDINSILNCFSTDMTQYWDLKYPSQEELSNRYFHTWSVSSDYKYKDIMVKQVSKNVYDLYSDYEFYSNKAGKTKTVHAHVRFLFDDDNRIVKSFGVN